MIGNKKKLTLGSIVSKKSTKKPRREAFLSRDVAYLSVTPRITLGKMLGSGNYGTVYAVKGNDHLVVKVPNGFTPNTEGFYDISSRARSRAMIEDEAGMYQEYKLMNEPLFIPTKIVEFDSMGNGKFIGLVRPKVKTIIDYGMIDNKDKGRDIKHVTDSKIIDIRNKLIDLSYKGFSIEDALQIGFDRHGRSLVYDFGGLVKYTISNNEDLRFVFERNNGVWIEFLRDVGKLDAKKNTSEYYRVLAKYGEITPK